MTTNVIDIPYGYGPDAPDPLATTEGQRALSRIEAAASRFAAARDKLHRPDGSPVWGPEEHKERLNALVAEFDAAARPIHDDAEQDEAAGRVAFEALAGADPIDALTPDELARANGLRPFVAEECAESPVHQLLPRMRAALASKDTVTLILWQRYTGRRWDQVSAAGSTAGPGMSEFRTLLDQLQAAIADPQADAKREAAIRRVATARAVQQRVNRVRGQLDGSDAAAQAAMRRQIAATF